MLTFCGSDLSLSIEQILSRADWPTVCSAEDPAGDRWLIVQVDIDPVHPAWVCARVSELAMDAVVQGVCGAWDAVRHSLTGVVELVSLDAGRVVPDRCLLCQDLPDVWRCRTGPAVMVAA
jgi:hypothetical protein